MFTWPGGPGSGALKGDAVLGGSTSHLSGRFRKHTWALYVPRRSSAHPIAFLHTSPGPFSCRPIRWSLGVSVRIEVS